MRSFRAVLACALVAGAVAVPATAAPPTTVNGRVLDTLGRPVQGATVKVTRESEPGVVGAVTCLFTFFLPAMCRPSTATATTNRTGYYSVRVDNRTFLGQPGERTLTITEPHGTVALPGAVTRVKIYWAQQTLKVPDMRVWNAHPTVTAEAPLVLNVHTDPLPAAFGNTGGKVPSVYLLQNGGQVWKYAESEDDRPADARTVETGTNGVNQYVVATLGHGYRVEYWSRALPLTGLTPVRPVSRGAQCATYGNGDVLVPLAKCAFTDGALTRTPEHAYLRPSKACLYPTSSCAHPRWVRLDLGSPKVVQAAVVRGCTLDPNDMGTFPAEVSLDGTTWAPLVASNPWSALVYAPPTPTRYVRVNLWSCGFPPTEISVFGLV